MTRRLIQPRPLTARAFAPFGDVIAVPEGAQGRTINYGHALRFDNLAHIDVTANGGEAAVSIFRASPPGLPAAIRVMERHPLSSQAFIPLSSRPFLVVVAPPGDFAAEKISAFLAGPGQGVNYHAGVWHHFCLALDKASDFLVIERKGEGDNCDEVMLDPARPLFVDLAADREPER
ncbi:MAG: ureidoglycolate lyase [Pseudomonadota bacterium]